MFNWRSNKDYFKSMRGYIGFTVALFAAGIFIGASNPAFRAFLDSQLSGLDQLFNLVERSENKTITMIVIIFLNNAIKSILIIYLGAFMGLLPFIFIVVNGMILGYLVQIVAERSEGLTVMELILKGLLPHGIIEIPALILASAYGMKFGSLIWRASGSLFFARSKLGGIGREIEVFVKRTIPVMVILTVAILAASIIESTLTVWLITL